MRDVFILSAVRTPIGKFGGSLASLTAADMGVVAAKAAMERAGVQPDQVDETIFGNARQAGGGPNPARQISIRSGVPRISSSFYREYGLRLGDEEPSRSRRSGDIADGNSICVLAGGTRVDVAASLLSGSALGISAGQSGTGRWHVSRRILLSDGEDGDGRDRRAACRAIQDFARGAG